MNSSSSRSDIGLLVLRLGVPLLLLAGHGWPKLMHFGERLNTFADPIGMGPQVSFLLVLLAEVVCSILVALGLFTRFAVVPPVIFFLVAALVQHAADPWQRKELAVVYLIPFITLWLTGPGRYSIDALLGRRGKK